MSMTATIHTTLLAAALAGACSNATYEFDQVPVGDQGFSRDPKPRTNQQWIRAIYSDLLGRAPESYDFVVQDTEGNQLASFPVAEQDFLLFTLDGVGDPTPLRALIAAGLVRSEEVALPAKDEVDDPAAFISEQFRRFLGRDPNVYELDAFLAEWDEDPSVNPRTVVRALVGSREYQSF